MSTIQDLITMSNRYGADSRYVLAGGGNTSCKENGVLYIKGSGTSLKTITESGFVKMDIERLSKMWDKNYGQDTNRAEQAVLRDMMDARLLGEEEKRPSVETLLHALFPFTFVLHLHPALVNGLTCGKNGFKRAANLFPDALFMPATRPGYTLAIAAKTAADAYFADKGVFPSVIFMQNHGVFVGADSLQKIDELMNDIMKTLLVECAETPDFASGPAPLSDEAAAAVVRLRSLYAKSAGTAAATVIVNREAVRLSADKAEALRATGSAYTPDHIVYCRVAPLFLAKNQFCADGMGKAFSEYEKRWGFPPKAVFLEDAGAVALGKTKREANIAAEVFNDAIAVSVYARSFGGPLFMTDDDIDFILNWEVESYRTKVALSGAAKRLSQKIAVVTGGAQGYGLGIAEGLAAEGALIVIADLNAAGAAAAAEGLNAAYGAGTAYAFAADVSNEESVAALCRFTAVTLGGIDIFINNAGIVRAGALEEMNLSDFELVTRINYTAYFLCAKYASLYMKLAHETDADAFFDIIQINSKSGLSGSNKNFAYAGSKFGGVGLTQSFALELTPYNIKVNSICPGNFFDGPLWSDPEKGLFVQYLKAGKVKGAKTVQDVKRAYEEKIPMGRGCRIEDVVRAIVYVVGQQYETGQAIPVTGGQVMLK